MRSASALQAAQFLKRLLWFEASASTKLAFLQTSVCTRQASPDNFRCHPRAKRRIRARLQRHLIRHTSCATCLVATRSRSGSDTSSTIFDGPPSPTGEGLNITSPKVTYRAFREKGISNRAKRDISNSSFAKAFRESEYIDVTEGD